MSLNPSDVAVWWRVCGRLSALALLVVFFCVTLLDEVFAQDGNAFTQAVGDAQVARKQGNLEQAWDLYGQALKLEGSSEVAPVERELATAQWCEVGIEWVAQLVETSRHEQAVVVLEGILARMPDYRPALEWQQRLREFWGGAPVDDAFAQKAAQVRQWLLDAAHLEEIARWDEADLRYDWVLNLDPYNVAAREGQQRLRQAKALYYESSRALARADALQAIDRAWEPEVTPIYRDLAGEGGQESMPLGVSLQEKMNAIVLPLVEFRQASLREVVDFLSVKGRDLDTLEDNPQARGVNFVIQLDEAQAAALPDISLRLQRVPLIEVVKYVARLTNLAYRIEPHAVVFLPQGKDQSPVVTRIYRIPPNFFSVAPLEEESASSDPFSLDPEQSAGPNRLLKRLSAKEFLESNGVSFPPGTAANYIASTSTLVVRNTQDNIDLLEALIGGSVQNQDRQLRIRTLVLEVNEERLKELGFDWLLGPFDVTGSRRIFGSGGTVGNQIDGGLNNFDYPFVPPGPGQVPVGQNPLTAGNRTGSRAFSLDSIDALIQRSDTATEALSTAAPGIFALAGVFTDPQFQMVIRAISQKKGVDVLTAPSVVTKSGQKANLEIVREMFYPTEYEPPEIPDAVGTSLGDDEELQSFAPVDVKFVPYTPAQPTSFELTKVGVILEVEPIIAPDGQTVELNIAPSMREFEGFVDYGSSLNYALSFVPNEILQPIFKTNRAQTTVNVWDGQTVVLAGLRQSTMETIDDKTPILGDLPIIGRLFQSKGQRAALKSIIMFVSVDIIDPSGKPQRQWRAQQPVLSSQGEVNLTRRHGDTKIGNIP